MDFAGLAEFLQAQIAGVHHEAEELRNRSEGGDGCVCSGRRLRSSGKQIERRVMIHGGWRG